MERKTKKNQHCFQLRNAGVPDKKNLYYPQVEGVTQKDSLLPTSVTLNM